MPSRNRHRERARAHGSDLDPGSGEQGPVTTLDTSDAVSAFVHDVTDPERDRPLIVVTCASDTDTPRIDLPALTAAIDDRARVYVHGSHAIAWSINKTLPGYLASYGGACRVIRPDPQPGDLAHLHPVFITRAEDDPGATIRRLSSELDRVPSPTARAHLRSVTTGPSPDRRSPHPSLGARATRPGLVAVPTPGEVAGGDIDTAVTATDSPTGPDTSTVVLPAGPDETTRLREMLARSERQREDLARRNTDLVDALNTARAHHGATRTALVEAEAEVAALTARLAEPEDARRALEERATELATDRARLIVRVESLDEERDRLSGRLTVLREERERLIADAERADTAQAEARAAKKRAKAASEALASARASSATPVVYSDPAKQFRWEVHHAWMTTVPESQRGAERALRSHDLGADFIDSVTNLHGVKREKIIATVLDVLTGVVWTSNGRAAHQFRTGSAGGNDAVVREDGAVLWRCAIQRNTPSARRLMWWECPDGVVELGLVAIHDDFTIPRPAPGTRIG